MRKGEYSKRAFDAYNEGRIDADTYDCMIMNIDIFCYDDEEEVQQGGGGVIDIDLDNLNEDDVYKAFRVEGNEGEALNDIYLELFELIGRDATLKLFKYFRGDKIDCPMRLYRPEFVADLAKQTTDRRERAKIARAAGYTVKFIETMLRKRREEGEAE